MSDIINIELLACPKCSAGLVLQDNSLSCTNCGTEYKIENNIPIFLPTSHNSDIEGADYIEHYQTDAELFDYFAERDCMATELDERRLRQYILSQIPKNAKTILDCGSGSSWLAKEIQSGSNDLTIFDISLKNVEIALNKYPNPNYYGVVGDALNPPFPPESFDCIIASEVIEHIQDPALFVEKLFSLIKSGGKFIISTPYKEKLQLYLCVHCNKPTPKNAHLHSFDENKLEALYKGNNLKSRNFYIFGNKALIMLRTHVILQYLPFPIWKLIDKLANLIIPKQEHIIMIIEKE